MDIISDMEVISSIKHWSNGTKHGYSTSLSDDAKLVALGAPSYHDNNSSTNDLSGGRIALYRYDSHHGVMR